MFEDFEVGEIDPKAAGMALLGGICSLIVMKNVEIGILWKLLSPILTAGVCYFVVLNIKNR